MVIPVVLGVPKDSVIRCLSSTEAKALFRPGAVMPTTLTIEQRGERPNGLSTTMDDVVKFHNVEILLSQLTNRKYTGIIPLSWTQVSFIPPDVFGLDKTTRDIEEWIIRNTKGKYYITYTTINNPNDKTMHSYNAMIYVYFEDKNDAFYMKLIGLETIINENSKLF